MSGHAGAATNQLKVHEACWVRITTIGLRQAPYGQLSDVGVLAATGVFQHGVGIGDGVYETGDAAFIGISCAVIVGVAAVGSGLLFGASLSSVGGGVEVSHTNANVSLALLPALSVML